MTTASPSGAAGGASRVLVTLAVMGATVIQVLDTTIVNVALPHMAGELSATTDQISWVLTSYIVAASIVMPMTGFLADRMGRRKYLLVSILGFVVASALCGIAGSLPEMVVFRLLQGVFGASLVPLSQAIMVDSYPPEDRGKALAIWGMGVMVAPILGPTIGGWLTETVNWRWNFYINVPIGALSLLLAWRYVPDTPVKERDMDWWGFVFLAAFIAGLQYTLDRGQQADWFDATAIRVSVGVLAAGLALFVWHAATTRRHPLFSLRMFADRNFTAATVVGAAMGLSLYGGMLLQPLFFEGILQFPTFDTGLAMVPRGVGSLVSMLLVGRLLPKFGAKKLIYFGIAVSLVGAWMLDGREPRFHRPQHARAALAAGIRRGLRVHSAVGRGLRDAAEGDRHRGRRCVQPDSLDRDLDRHLDRQRLHDAGRAGELERAPRATSIRIASKCNNISTRCV